MRSRVELGLVKSQPKPKSILDLIKISQPQPSSHFFLVRVKFGLSSTHPCCSPTSNAI